MGNLRVVKGMHDILPADMRRWHRVEQAYREITARYGFGEVRTPIVEHTPVFTQGVGETTDIVEKEMYSFVDKGDKTLTMRPEGTAAAVRAYVQHGVQANSPVTKWIYMGPMFRRERPAKGRYRQFYQLGAEVFGDPGPYVDAELIQMLVAFLHEVGIGDLEVLVSSLGSGDTHARYRDALREFLSPHRDKLSEDSQRRLETNPLRVLDSKFPGDKEVVAHAPSVLDHLSDDDRTHFNQLRESLEKLGVPYSVDQSIVRGLDYYTRTVFEVKDRSGKLGAQDTICGGGRYDNLVQTLGGPATAAIGYGVGVERLLLSASEVELGPELDAFVVVTSPDLRADAVALMAELRQAGVRVDADLRGNSLKSQMRRADKSGASYALVLGPDELARGVAQTKDLRKNETSDVARVDLPRFVRG